MQPLTEFIYQARPARVIFGAGSLRHLEREVLALGARRALVLCTPEQRAGAEDVMRRLGERAAGIFDRATMHVPLEVAREASACARSLEADCAIAVGGGSTIGLGKAIALEDGLPILAIPTTYAGSEMTPIFGLTEGGAKRTGTDFRVLPRTVIYDPELTLSLPAGMSVESGLNAIAHAAEGLYARDANPVMSLMAEEGIRAMAQAIPALKTAPLDRDARAHALYGAWLCGTVLGNVGMALHHKLCHTLGGMFNLPHAALHTVMLPQSLAYNASAVPHAMERVAKAIRRDDGAQGIFDLALHNGASVSLRDIGMREADLDDAAAAACANPYWNPRPLEVNAIRELLQRAFEGARPEGT